MMAELGQNTCVFIADFVKHSRYQDLIMIFLNSYLIKDFFDLFFIFFLSFEAKICS